MDDDLLASLFPTTSRPQERARALRTTSLVPDQQRTPPAAERIDPFGIQKRAMEAAEQASQMLDAEPDIAPWQEYARRRSGEGSQQLMLALAAQQAGKEFQPMAGHFLKQALSARDPLQVGKAGMITGEGEFIADPFYQREKRAELLLKRADTLDRLAVTAQTAQERAQAAEDARKAREAYQQSVLGVRQQGIDLQRQGLDLRSDLGRAAADARRDREADREAARREREEARAREGNERRVDGIRREYNARLGKVQEGAGFANSVLQSLADPRIAKSALGQTSLVFQFGKMLDQDSVVREAEQQMIMRARGWLDSLQMTPEKIQSGVFLTPQQLAEMGRVASLYATGANTRVDDLKSMYADLAQRNGLRVEDIVLGYRPGGAGPAAPAGAVREKPPGGAPAGAVREK